MLVIPRGFLKRGHCVVRSWQSFLIARTSVLLDEDGSCTRSEGLSHWISRVVAIANGRHNQQGTQAGGWEVTFVKAYLHQAVLS